MGKDSCYDNNGLKKGAWTEDEDMKLTAYIRRYGHWNWSLLPKFAGVSRSGKSCRLRWMNYLRPNLKHGNFTEEEDNIIIGLHSKIGNKWSKMATKLPGRTDNEIKNRWNTYLKKRVKNELNVRESEHPETLEPDQTNPTLNCVKEMNLEQQKEGIIFPKVRSESPSSHSSTGLSSCWWSDMESAGWSDHIPQTFDDGISDNFWTKPFLQDNDNIILSSDDLWSPFNFVNDFIPQSSFQDTLIDCRVSMVNIR